MKNILLSTALTLVCSSVFAAQFMPINQANKINGIGTFVVQPGDTCQGIGSYIQTHQCANKIISFIASSTSGKPTMCVWNAGWQNGQAAPIAGETGYFSC